MHKRVLLLGLVLLAGCAATFTKPGTTEQDVKQASWDCKRESDGMKHRLIWQRSAYDECMDTKGWTKVKE